MVKQIEREDTPLPSSKRKTVEGTTNKVGEREK